MGKSGGELEVGPLTWPSLGFIHNSCSHFQEVTCAEVLHRSLINISIYLNYCLSGVEYMCHKSTVDLWGGL